MRTVRRGFGQDVGHSFGVRRGRDWIVRQPRRRRPRHDHRERCIRGSQAAAARCAEQRAQLVPGVPVDHRVVRDVRDAHGVEVHSRAGRDQRGGSRRAGRVRRGQRAFTRRRAAVRGRELETRDGHREDDWREARGGVLRDPEARDGRRRGGPGDGPPTSGAAGQGRRGDRVRRWR